MTAPAPLMWACYERPLIPTPVPRRGAWDDERTELRPGNPVLVGVAPTAAIAEAWRDEPVSGVKREIGPVSVLAAPAADSPAPPPGFDAREWVDAWVKTIVSHPLLPYDEGAMLAWFAGAIMRGFDVGLVTNGEGRDGLAGLVSVVESIAAEGCRVTHVSYPRGATCREVRQCAIDHPDRYSDDYRERLARGEELCYRCKLAAALDVYRAAGLLDEPAAQPAARSVPPSSWSANGSPLSLPCPRCGAEATVPCGCFADPAHGTPEPASPPCSAPNLTASRDELAARDRNAMQGRR